MCLLNLLHGAKVPAISACMIQYFAFSLLAQNAPHILTMLPIKNVTLLVTLSKPRLERVTGALTHVFT